jgi:hypothetical protein
MSAISEAIKAEKPDPRDLARHGLGWEDVKVICGITEAEARLIVLGRYFYMKWKVRQEAKAS